MLPVIRTIRQSPSKPVHPCRQPGGKLVREGVAPSAQHEAGSSKHGRRRRGKGVRVVCRHLVEPRCQVRKHVGRPARCLANLGPFRLCRRGRNPGSGRHRDRAWAPGEVDGASYPLALHAEQRFAVRECSLPRGSRAECKEKPRRMDRGKLNAFADPANCETSAGLQGARGGLAWCHVTRPDPCAVVRSAGISEEDTV